MGAIYNKGEKPVLGPSVSLQRSADDMEASDNAPMVAQSYADGAQASAEADRSAHSLMEADADRPDKADTMDTSPTDEAPAEADFKEQIMQALTQAWKASRQRKVQEKPRPVPDADGWQIYWIKRGNSSTAGDNYFITPRGDKLASLTAARRWLDRMDAAAAGVKLEPIDHHGRVIKEQPKEQQRQAHRLLVVAQVEAQAHEGSTLVRLQLTPATPKDRLERLIALKATQDALMPPPARRAGAQAPPGSEAPWRHLSRPIGRPKWPRAPAPMVPRALCTPPPLPWRPPPLATRCRRSSR